MKKMLNNTVALRTVSPSSYQSISSRKIENGHLVRVNSDEGEKEYFIKGNIAPQVKMTIKGFSQPGGNSLTVAKDYLK